MKTGVDFRNNSNVFKNQFKIITNLIIVHVADEASL
jgi:hypothetical protein